MLKTSESSCQDTVQKLDAEARRYPHCCQVKQLRDFYISRVMSGGVSVNEALLHVGQHDLPFGGVGASGMGHYHAREGFNTFSKLRPVFYQGPFSPIQLLFQPPYAGRAMSVLQTMIKLKT